MSLINEALKKEQTRRHSEQNGAVHPMVSRGYAGRRDDSKGALLLIGFAGLGVVMVGCVAAVIYFGKGYLGGLEGEQTTLAKVEAPAAPAPVGNDTPGAPASPLDGISADELAALKALLATKQAAEAKELEPETAPKAAPEPAGPNSEFANFIAKLPVQGTRVAGENSRLLLGGKVYKTGDIIDHERGLRFVEAIPGRVLFEDANGSAYEKNQ